MKKDEIIKNTKHLFYTKIMMVFWVTTVVVSLFWNFSVIDQYMNQTVKGQAQAFFDEIQTTRAWNAKHGGVYVKITETTQPNIYLETANREIYIDSLNIALTKINPAFMTRQIAMIANKKNNVRFNITSLNPIRPKNKADNWEEIQLTKFEKGSAEAFEYVEKDSLYRYMAPLMVEKSCLKCHEKQGYQLGDVRGGISVSIKGEENIESIFEQKMNMFIFHIIFLILGIIGLLAFLKFVKNQIKILENENLLMQQKNTQILKLKEKAEESNRLKNAFMNNMSHEIRTPLYGITSFLGLLQDPNIEADDKQEYIDMINKSSNRLIATVTDIIEISKIEAGLVEVSIGKVFVNEMLNELYELFSIDVENKGLKLYQLPSLSDDKAIVLTDNHKLTGILTNLIKNAIKFTDKGSITFGYNIIEDTEKGSLMQFYVKDTGIGVPKNKLQTIFNSFEQADIGNTRAFEGSGLGLSIAKSYVDILGGKIWLSSKENVGTEFVFTIPY